MKFKTWQEDTGWFWVILDEYDDELASDGPFETRSVCRQDGHAAYTDWEYEL